MSHRGRDQSVRARMRADGAGHVPRPFRGVAPRGLRTVGGILALPCFSRARVQQIAGRKITAGTKNFESNVTYREPSTAVSPSLPSSVRFSHLHLPSRKCMQMHGAARPWPVPWAVHEAAVHRVFLNLDAGTESETILAVPA